MSANDTPIRINGAVHLPFYTEDRCIWTTVLVSEDIEEVMLGSDWLQKHECVWDFRSGHISIDGRSAVTTTQRGNIKCRRVFVQECQEIPPRTADECNCPENFAFYARCSQGCNGGKS